MHPLLQHRTNPCFHPTPSRLEKKIIAYDDKLGRALTVHTVPTSLAPSQPWLSARTTITNTGCASQEGVGRPAPVSKGGRERRAARWSRRDSLDKPGKGNAEGATRTQAGVLFFTACSKKKKKKTKTGFPSPGQLLIFPIPILYPLKKIGSAL